MASDVDICNLALGHLGDEAIVAAISPRPDGSAQAEHCARFYPIARDQMVADHAWSFATKRATLAQLSTDELPDEWTYAYALPSQCLRALAIPDPTDATKTQDFVQETLSDGSVVIFTNAEQATLRYISQITDTTKFQPHFVVALARLLSSYLAGPVIKGETGMKVAQAMLGIYKKAELPDAKNADANAHKQNIYNEFVPDGLKARA